MAVDIDLLKMKIAEKGLTGEAISDILSIDQSTYYRKLKHNGKDFTVEQVYKLKGALALSGDDAIRIFFKQ